MTTKDSKKLQKALEMMKKAQSLIAEVENSDKKFRYSLSSNFRTNRVMAAVEIIESEIQEFCK